MEKPVKSIGVTYGVILGIILILFTAVAYAFDLSLLTQWWFGLASFLILLIIGVIAVAKAKKKQTGYYPFKDAFTTFFLTILIGTFLVTAFSIVVFSIFDPEAAKDVTEITIEASRQMMEKFGATEASINEAMAKMEEENQFSITNQLTRFISGLAFYSVLGLIVALIFREKDPTKA